MKIVEVKKVVETNYYIQTDDGLFPFYRRSEYRNWENLMGESWEPHYNDEELEKEFQNWLTTQNSM